MERARWCALAVLCVLVLGACHRQPKLETQPVEGTLTLDGKPVEGATVTFVPVVEGQGASATGITDAGGRFTLTVVDTTRGRATPGGGTVPGDYFVGVMKTTFPQAASEEEEEGGGKTTGTEAPSEPKLTHVVPQKYNDPRRSGLRVTVKEGKNVIPIELSSR